MKLGCLYSGGKDSNFALFEACKCNDVVCLITMVSENKESYMFQTQGVDFTELQAKCLGISQIKVRTFGIKEKELDDLKVAIQKAKDDYGIEGIVTGAINSVYQASRVQNICNDLGLWCFNPLWQKNEEEFLNELIENKFKVVIVGVYSYPLTKDFLGKVLDMKLRNKLIEMKNEFKISPIGEGGELETFVVDSPIFKKRIEVIEFDKVWENYSGEFIIKNVKLVEK